MLLQVRKVSKAGRKTTDTEDGAKKFLVVGNQLCNDLVKTKSDVIQKVGLCSFNVRMENEGVFRCNYTPDF